MKIQGKNLGTLFLAPMAGVSEIGFRTVCKMAGADLTYTEMVNSAGLVRNNQATKELLKTNILEQPKAVQIFGHNPQEMANACAMSELDQFDLIDINFGCPAPKIIKNGDGSALLKQPLLIKDIVERCVKATNKPISCKIRMGFNNGENCALEIAKICEESGAKLITVHGRTREQMYSGTVNLEAIAKVKANLKIPVVGNGDVVDFASYNQMKQTGVDAVMIGRGALGNPNIFAELKGQEPLNKLELVLKHIQILKQNFSESFVNATMKKHLLWYIAGVPGASKIKLQVATAKSIEESLQLIRQILI